MIKIIGITPHLSVIHDWSLDQASEELVRRFGFIREDLMLLASTGHGGATTAGEFWLSVADYRQLGAPYAPVLACEVQNGKAERVLRFNVRMEG